MDRKEVVKSVGLLIVVMLLFLTVLEVTFRLAYPQSTLNQLVKSSPRIYESSDYLPWGLKPNTNDMHHGLFNEFSVNVSINSQGLRNAELQPKQEDTYRILVIGDSFTFGYGVENNETYPYLLQQKLDEASNKKIEVINAGYASGYGTETFYAYLKKEGLKLEPDMILIGFLPGNDFTDITVEQWEEVDEKGLPVSVTGGDWIDESGRRRQVNPGANFIENPVLYRTHLFFNTNSHVYAFFKERLKGFVIKQSPPTELFSRKEYTQREEMLYNKSTKILKGIINLANEKDVSVAMVMIPIKVEVYEDQFVKGLQFYDLNPDEFEINKIQTLLTTFGENNNMQVIDLRPSFVEYVQQSNSKVYFDHDMHWTPLGHEIASNTIAKEIVLTKR